MATFTHRDVDLETAAERARASTPPGQGSVFGSQLTGMMLHGGLYSLADTEMMHRRVEAMDGASLQALSPGAGRQQVLSTFTTTTAAIRTHYFYHIEKQYYKLHAGLVSYLTYPNRHLKSPLPLPANGFRPHGKTFATGNLPSPDIPAAMTFVGQFIDHDLTLNAVNLFDKNENPTTTDKASPLVDLDSVYGPRMDDDPNKGNREIPMDNGYFRLRAIPGGGYDVCRKDEQMFGQRFKALIGDKRNDENQIILQIHILLMRLHNAFRAQYPYDEAKRQTILHWQSFVATEYLPLVCDPQVVTAITQKLAANPNDLIHKPGNTPAGPGVLGMPHEFAIGFRFGHSQLRSRYQLNASYEFRLFDNLSDGTHDLQGGKCLEQDRIIDWPFFLRMQGGHAARPSNLIDTKVNEVVFDLPESAIPDQVNLVTNLPFRNLQRSDSVKLCAGEDLAGKYNATYSSVIALTPQQVEPDAEYRPLFELETNKFRTPLWYYLLREAEVARAAAGHAGKGHLGQLGSHLVSEVILSGIYYTENNDPNFSFLRNAGWTSLIPTTSGSDRNVKLIDIANYVASTNVQPPACEAGNVCP